MKRAHIWPFVIVAAIFAASCQSKLAAPNLGFEFSIDKLAHFLVFGLLATSILRTPRFFKNGWKGALTAAILVSLYGIIDEYRQSLTPGRTVEFADWAYDTAGAIIAVSVYLKWTLYRKILEWRPIPTKAPAPLQPESLHSSGSAEV